jgi:ABC-type Na+ efflux pump permease subunit
MKVAPGTISRAAGPFAAGAMVVTAAVGLLPLAGWTPEVAGTMLTAGIFVAIPLVAIIAAGFAGYRALHLPGGTAGDGAIAGFVVGVGVLIGAVIGLAALGWIAGSYPEFQELVRNSEPNPDARLPYEWIAPVGAAAGALIGFLSGLTYIVPATLAGLATGVLGGTTNRTAAPQPLH